MVLDWFLTFIVTVLPSHLDLVLGVLRIGFDLVLDSFLFRRIRISFFCGVPQGFMFGPFSFSFFGSLLAFLDFHFRDISNHS